MCNVSGMTRCESTGRPLSAFPQLEVLTNLANETNIPTVLREFQVRAGAGPIQRGPESGERATPKGPEWRNGYLGSSPHAPCWPWARESLGSG